MARPAKRRLVYMPVADLLDAPRNVKDHADAEIGGSIGRFGMMEMSAPAGGLVVADDLEAGRASMFPDFFAESWKHACQLAGHLALSRP